MLVAEKDKQIEKLRHDLQKANSVITQSIHKHSETTIKTPRGEINPISISNSNSNNRTLEHVFKLDFKNKIHSKEINILNPELFSDRISKNNSMVKVLAGSSVKENIKSKGVFSNFLKKSNKTSFIKDTYLSHGDSFCIYNLFNLIAKSPQKPKKEFKPVEDILQTTLKIFKEKAVEKKSSNMPYTNNNELKNNLNQIKSRTLKVLNHYSDKVAKS